MTGGFVPSERRFLGNRFSGMLAKSVRYGDGGVDEHDFALEETGAAKNQRTRRI